MAAKNTTKTRQAVPIDPGFAPVVDAFANRRGVSAGRMMSSYGLKVNGKIFAMFGKGRFVVKLPKSRVDAMVTAGEGERFDPGHGRVMKEWVAVGLEKAAWVEIAAEAYDFVKHLDLPDAAFATRNAKRQSD